MKIELRPSGPLTGALHERRVVRLWSRNQGKRAAVLNVNAGQGTQDLGFRSDVLITFDIKPSNAILNTGREEAENLLELFLFVVSHEPTEQGKRLEEAAWSLHNNWLRHPAPKDRTAEELLIAARRVASKLLEKLPTVDLAATSPKPLANGR